MPRDLGWDTNGSKTRLILTWMSAEPTNGSKVGILAFMRSRCARGCRNVDFVARITPAPPGPSPALR